MGFWPLRVFYPLLSFWRRLWRLDHQVCVWPLRVFYSFWRRLWRLDRYVYNWPLRVFYTLLSLSRRLWHLDHYVYVWPSRLFRPFCVFDIVSRVRPLLSLIYRLPCLYHYECVFDLLKFIYSFEFIYPLALLAAHRRVCVCHCHCGDMIPYGDTIQCSIRKNSKKQCMRILKLNTHTHTRRCDTHTCLHKVVNLCPYTHTQTHPPTPYPTHLHPQ